MGMILCRKDALEERIMSVTHKAHLRCGRGFPASIFKSIDVRPSPEGVPPIHQLATIVQRFILTVRESPFPVPPFSPHRHITQKLCKMKIKLAWSTIRS